MKHLNNFKMFESNRISEIESEIRDILVDIEDKYFEIKLEHHNETLYVIIWNPSYEDPSVIVDNILRLKDYMISIGCKPYNMASYQEKGTYHSKFIMFNYLLARLKSMMHIHDTNINFVQFEFDISTL